MKPFFGIDITTDKKNETMNAAPFIVQKPSAASVRKLEQEEEAATEALKEYFKKRSRKVDRFLCAVLFGVVAAALLFAALTFGLAHRLLEGYEHLSVPAVLVPGVVFAILSFVCGALYRKAGADPESDGGETEEDDDEDDDEAGEEDDAPLSTTEATIFQELRIPKTTKSVDVIGFKYRDMRGRIRPRGRDGVNGATVNPLYTFKGYVKDNALCLPARTRAFTPCRSPRSERSGRSTSGFICPAGRRERPSRMKNSSPTNSRRCAAEWRKTSASVGTTSSSSYTRAKRGGSGSRTTNCPSSRRRPG